MRLSKNALILIQGLAFLAGGFVFWRLLHSVGFSSLHILWAAAGWWLLPMFFLYPFMSLWDTLSWQFLFQTRPRPDFLSLFWIRLAGEAVNTVTPGVDVGGEPLKVKWVAERARIPIPDAASATILAKTSTLAAEGLFVWAGLWASFYGLAWPQGSWEFFMIAAVFIGAGITALFLFERSKLFGGWNPAVNQFYAHSMPVFLLCVLLNLLGWLSGAFELWVFAHWVGAELGLTHAFIIEALVQIIRVASFFIPGNIGTQEAGYIFLTGLMGHEPSLGMALSLLKRARQIFWTVVGFGVWGFFRRRIVIPKSL